MTQTDNKDGSFLVPQYTLPQSHPKTDLVWSLLDQVLPQGTRKHARNRRFNALCTVLHGVNRDERHTFYTASNAAAYRVWGWPIKYREMASATEKGILPLLVAKGWLKLKTVHSTPWVSKKAHVYSAPAGSPLILPEPFTPKRMHWSPPVIQVRPENKVGATDDEKSSYIDVAYMAEGTNKRLIEPLKEQMEVINDLALGDHLFESEMKGDTTFDRFYEGDGWRRVFRGNVNKGGRLTASYMNADKDLRTHWRIDGEPLAQIDVHACGLVILSSLRGHHVQPSDGDLYRRVQTISPWDNALPDRQVVKKTIQTVISNDYLPLEDYPKAITSDEKLNRLARELPWGLLRSDIERHYPWIAEGRRRNQQLEIQKAESDWMLDVMQQLLEQGIGVLSLHDAIMVPRSKIDVTKEAMSSHFEACFGIRPLLDVEIL